MEKILIDFSEYERLRAIEKQYIENRKTTSVQKPESSTEPVNQDGRGNIPTASLQKEMISQENGPSNQTILENPTAPVIFTSEQTPPISESEKSGAKATPVTSGKKEEKWWFLD